MACCVIASFLSVILYQIGDYNFVMFSNQFSTIPIDHSTAMLLILGPNGPLHIDTFMIRYGVA